MIDRYHNIYQTIFDLNFFSKEKNHALQEEISNLFNSKISNEIDKLFSEYASHDEVIEIAQLTIDTGELLYGDLKSELPKRIIHSLREELDKLKSKTLGNQRFANFKSVHSQHYYLQSLEYFLLTGEIKWQDKKKGFTLERLLIELIENNSAQVVKLLKRTGKKEDVRKRIVYQFNEPEIITIIKTAEPSNGNNIINYLNDLNAVQKKNHLIKTESSEFKKANYLFVLTYLFVERGSIFNTRSFVKSLLKQMAAHYNIQYKELLLMLVQSIRDGYSASIKNGLLFFVREIFAEDYILETPVELNEIATQLSEISLETKVDSEVFDEYVYYFLERGFPPIYVKSLNQLKLRELLQEIIHQRFNQLGKFISKAPKKRIAKHVVQFFGNDITKEIIKKYQPANYAWINSFGEHLLKANKHSAFIKFQSTNLSELILQEAILYTTLTLEKNIFNRETFLQNVVTFVAKKVGSNASSLDIEIKDVFEQIGITMYTGILKNTDPNLQQLNSANKETNDTPISTPTLNEAQSKVKELESLKYFLLHGKKPWWLTNSSIKKIETLWGKYFLESRNKKLISFIRENIIQQRFRKNILSLLKEGVLLNDEWATSTKDESQQKEKIWPIIKNNLTYKTQKILIEVHLIYTFLKQEKKKEIVWKELQKTFAAYSIHQNEFYKEILQLNKLIPNLYENNFFSLLYTNLAENIRIEKSNQNNQKPNDPKSQKSFQEDLNISNLLNENEFKKNKNNKDYIQKGDYSELEQKDENLIKSNTKDYELGEFLKQNGIVLSNEQIKDNELKDIKDQDENSSQEKNSNNTKLDDLNENEKIASIDEKSKNNDPNNTFNKNDIAEEANSLKTIASKGIANTDHNGTQSSLEDLLDYLHTGNFPSPTNKQVKQLILTHIKNLDAEIPTREIRILLLTLKNEASINRLFKELNESEKKLVVKHLFPNAYAFLNEYLKDLEQCMLIPSVKSKFNIEHSLVIKLTLLYLVEHSGKTIKISDYVRFVIKRLFKDYHSFVTFFNSVKINIHKGNLKLATFLPSVLEDVNKRNRKEEKKKEEENKKEEKNKNPNLVFIDNAGLILLWPFFTFYFKKLELINDDNKFVSKTTANRAAHLLEYLVTGSKKAKEHTMLLNKLLCNIPRNHPLNPSIKLKREEIDLSKELLHIAISRWEIIKNTSFEGLRESFLKRAGKIEWDDEKVYLKVESKSYDMLIDKIPWSISVIRLPWMEKPLHVKWR
ncbi:MAG: contractile injection system tape measure protein [Sphingobacteriaceae bacterium]